MNVLIITGHPAQVHNFRHLKKELETKGHSVFWAATNKDISKYLLDINGINYLLINKPGKGVFSKMINLIKNTFKIFFFVRRKKIDIIISRVSPYGAIAGFFNRTPHISLADTESSGIYDTIFTKFVSVFMTSKSFQRTLRKDQIRFDGNIELFYLHPMRFKPLPKEQVTALLNIKKDEPYIIMRFVSWDAYHDKGLSGFSDENKMRAVEKFSPYAKVFISAEKELPPELESYRIKIPSEKMHDVLAHATLFFGESATMASESAVLGIPAVYLDKNGRGYTNEEEKFGLVYNFKTSLSNQNSAIEKGLEILKKPILKTEMQKKRTAFLESKIDVTAFLTWFVENYPESFKIMKENPDYQYNFK